MDDTDRDFGLTLRPSDATPSSVWTELARAAGVFDDEELSGDKLAGLLNTAGQPDNLAPRLYDALNRLVQRGTAGPITELHRTSQLVAALRPELLGRALAAQSNLAERKRFLNAAIDLLTPAALRNLVLAAGKSYDHPPSATLEALLAKLQLNASTWPHDRRRKADRVFRSLVAHMVGRWSVSRLDTSTIGYEHVFHTQDEEKTPAEVTPEPERVVQLALETGVIGAVLWTAVAELSSDEKLPDLLRMLKSAPADSPAARMIAQQFANPQRLIQMLREDPIDFAAVDALLDPMRLNAADTLLNELISSPSRATRRALLERLARLGPGIEPMVLTKLRDERWFVLRNMLHLMNEANCPIDKLPLEVYQKHADPRVRREAAQLSFKDPMARDRALAASFRDADPSLIRAALKDARQGLPDAAVPILAKRILETDFPPEFRVPALQLLARSKSLLALDALLKFVAGGTTLLGKPKLAAKSPEMLTALKGLARSWRSERRASPLVMLAASSSDPHIAAAAAGGDGAERSDDGAA
jgi:hypothetical protein